MLRIFVKYVMIILIIAFQSCVLNSNVKEIEIWFGGDVHFGIEPNSQVVNPLAEILENTVGIINLEGPISNNIPKEKALANAPENIYQLHKIGVKVITNANNHSNDLGVLGEEETDQELKKQGFIPVSQLTNPVTTTIGNLSIVVAAYDLTFGVSEKLFDDLKVASKKGDLLIVAFHVTSPPSYLPSAELKKAVEVAYKAGAKIIVSHGSHNISFIEHRTNALIAWGLGNLAFNCDCTKEKDGLIFKVLLSGKEIKRAEVIPIKAGLNGEATRLTTDPNLIFDLLEALGSKNLKRFSERAEF